MRVLGIDVEPSLTERWKAWLAPNVQPFFVDSASDWPAPPEVDTPTLTAELRDTFKVWRMPMRDSAEVAWLDQRTFHDLPRADRARLVREQFDRRRGAVPSVIGWRPHVDESLLRRQADGHRFVWWPTLVAGNPAAILTNFVQADGRPSRHRDVAESTWQRCALLLPYARRLAGTFAHASGPNCFGTVLAAAGVPDTAGEWVLQDQFNDWLAQRCAPGGHDQEPGTVFVWRDFAGRPVHAAVTLGDGWAIEKPAQTWWTPRVVLDVRELVTSNRAPGQRLERHQMRPT